MNWFNHFIFAFWLLLLTVESHFSVFVLAIYALIFGCLIDLDFITRKYLIKSKVSVHRTLIQEPMGVIIFGLPISLMLAWYIEPMAMLLVLIPYTSHVFLDYLSHHDVRPLDPFSSKVVHVGFIHPLMHPFETSPNQSKINENYVLILNTLALLLTYFR